METVKRLFISLIVLLGYTAGAWAIEQDADGYYLIGSVQDWKDFAALVQTTPTANAKMTANVDLGNDQTMVGDAYYNNASMRVPFSGVFDGQGHTLTIHYVTANMPTSQRFFGGAPFGYVVNGTIRNLHTAGTLTSSHEGVSGMIGYADGNTLIENCRSSVNITFTASYGGAGFVYWSHSNSSILTLRDCIYDGTITGSQGYNSGLVVWYPNGECRIENSLVAATFNGSSYNCCTFIRPANSNHTITNSYYKNAVGTVQGTQATTEQLSDGTIATALQADRSEEIWVQDPVLGIPMLKIFANEETEQPSEALNGEFSITDNGIKVVFSRGNLQNVNNTWQFAIHQYDYFGENQSNGRDMFAFNDFSLPNNDDTWFNMTHDQWVYLLRDRSVTNTLSDGARFTMATLGGTYKGVILFPDNYTHPEGTGFTPGVFNSNSNYTAEVSLEGWALMEAAGCVFLPACGWNSAGSEWKSVGETAVYSTSSVYPTESRYYTPCFYVNRIDFDEWCNRASWTPVRLVQLSSGLNRDGDGYYLIGSVEDWKECSSLLTINPAINIRMTADIDLGDDQTELGSVNNPYKGTFDGQGHALTVAYSVTGSNSDHVAPFASIENATIENLHIKGTITTPGMRPASITSYVSGTSYIRNCWSEVAITSSRGSDIDAGGFVARVNSGQTLHIDDCTFTGSITYSYRSGFEAGGFVGWCQESGIVQIQNCLFAPTSIKTIAQSDDNKMFVSGYQSNVSFTNCYYRKVGSLEQWIEQGIATTEDELNDCTTSVALQNGRSEDVWVQDPLTNQPLPIIFATLQDEDGNYLIGSVQDWRRFAAIVETTPNANAKMTADVDLGDDQTMVGTYHQKYQGTFDGQGHTLTFNYNTEGMSFEPEQRDLNLNFLGAAPFRDIEGATIRNLHTAGSVTAEKIGASGLVGWTYGTNTIENCWSDVDIVSSNNTADTFAGFVAFQYGTQLNITDCVYTGKIQSASNISHAGFVAFQRYGKSSLNNCLLLLDEGSDVNTTTTQGLKYYTFVRNFESHNVANTINNCYYLTPFGVAQGTQTTDGDISDGTTATALQAGRSEEIWVQDPELGIPMLKIFAKTEEDNPVTDLSATTTANTYIISAAGKYKFNATVKGNGGLDPLTGTIATPIDPASIAGVKVLWELGDTYGRAIKYEDSAYDISYSDGYVYFSTPNSFTTGVACVAIYDSSDNILWSWDIWSTPEPGTATYNGNTFMDRNLCAVDLNYNRGFLYQWGRKDAFSAATGSYASFTFVPALFTAFNTVRGIQNIDYCIKHPTTHVNNGDENSWMSREEYEKLPWRDDIKTIYDPCPAGWRVPTAAEQNGYSGLPGTGFSNAINEFGNPGSGYYRSSTISSYPKAYAFRQSGQQNNWGTNPAFAIRPVKEGIYFIYTVPASGLGTFSAAENVIIPAGLTAYYCTTLKTYEDGKLGVRVSKLNGIIPANTGVLLEGSPGLSYPLTATTVEATAPAGNSLVAVVESEHIPATNGEYTNFMMKGGKFIKIQQDEESVKMPANRAYLPLLTSAISGSNAKEIMLYWDDEEATGIERMRNVENEIMRNGNIYNLNGQKLSAPQKGINIINGRKVIVK